MKEIREYDTNGNLTYCRYPDGVEAWWEYNDRGKQIYYRISDGYEWWYDYDENNNLICARWVEDS
jgi:YD repeat-containing protein